jgi:hypothetical protein
MQKQLVLAQELCLVQNIKKLIAKRNGLFKNEKDSNIRNGVTVFLCKY